MRKFIKEELEKAQDSAHNFNLQDQQALYGKPQPCVRIIDAFNVCLKVIDRDRANRAETLVSQPSEPSFGQWIDFKEKPPEKDGEYIIYVGVLAMDGKPYITIRKGHSFEFEHRAGKTKQFSFEGIFDTHKVIKWMPLPKP